MNSGVDAALVVLVVIGGLELFDRTSFALIALASRHHPLGSWAGGAGAFVLTTGIAVIVGSGLESLVGPAHVAILRIAGGIFLVGYALWLYRRPPDEPTVVARTARTALVTAFLTIFLLELGDTTMIFEVVFVANFGPLVVFVGGSAALVSVAAWDVWFGQRLGSRLAPERLRRLVVAVLLVVGAVTIAYGLEPGWFPALG